MLKHKLKIKNQVLLKSEEAELKGIIFDIQRCAFNDGPGIRTVIFFKGCPMHCSWCCNPESQSNILELRYKKVLCSHCGICVEKCPSKCIIFNSDKIDIDYNRCNICKVCVVNCPKGALSIFGEEMTVKDIIGYAYSDIEYYKISGGGITLSGGDVLMQYDFASSLLQAAKKKGINTCLETEGTIGGDKLKKILQWVDYIYWDYKLSDEGMHLQHTGVALEGVLDSLDIAASSNRPITLRCPIIPTLNDNKIHLRKIAELQKRYKSISEIHLLPYHTYGKHKYQEIGKVYSLSHLKSLDKQDIVELADYLKSLGASGVIIQ